MEILFGNKGIYHYIDAKVGTMQELEEKGYLYRVRMLVENELPYILPSSFICSDGVVWMSHNTKSCYGLQSMLQQKKMTGDWLRQILVQIVKQSEMLEKYLLDASDLVVCVEYLFFHTEKEEIRLLCVPGYQKPLKEQIAAFLEYLMPRFDHGDRAGERFLYECHQVLADEWNDISAFFALLESDKNADEEVYTYTCQDAGSAALPLHEAEKSVDTVFSKRFFLYALAGGAALALIIKYLFFDGTTGTAIFGIVWLSALIVLAIMTAREKDERDESDVAMQEYKMHERENAVGALAETDERTDCDATYLPALQQTEKKKEGMKLVPLSNGALEAFRIPADIESLTIGRDKTSDYRVTTTQISRVHARLFNRPDGLYIEDANSTNGTFINTKRIPPMNQQKLEKGDVVGLANEEFFIA